MADSIMVKDADGVSREVATNDKLADILDVMTQLLTSVGQGTDAVVPGRTMVKVTKAVEDLPNGTCRALWVGTEGTANLVDADGNICSDFPLVTGLNPISVRRVATGGSADDIWAIY